MTHKLENETKYIGKLDKNTPPIYLQQREETEKREIEFIGKLVKLLLNNIQAPPAPP